MRRIFFLCKKRLLYMSNLKRRLECTFRKWYPASRTQGKVHCQTWNFQSKKLNQRNRVDLYLPSAFFSNSSSTFPVLYINDGQDMEAVKMKATLEHLYKNEEIPPIIVAAFYPIHRMAEYGTVRQADYKGRGDQAKAYADFLLHEFIPSFEKQYPVSKLAQNRVIAGFSLGGLSAFDLAWNFPNCFGKVGVFSGALWWRSEEFNPEDPDADRIVHDQVEKDGHVGPLKFWFQTGTHDEKSDRNNNGIIDAIDDTLDLMKALKSAGYKEKDMEYVEVEKGVHHPSTWAQVMPDFLKWAFN